MSSLIVEVVAIDQILPHPQADALVLARIKGWQAVVRKGQFEGGDLVVYVPPDSVLPRELAERLGVVTYLSERTDAGGERVLVVRQVRLRGEPSFGLVIPPDDPSWPTGTEVSGHYGIRKFNPPVRTTAGDAEPEHPLFSRYTEVENLRSYPDVLTPGEQVVVTEKIHGTSVRIGYVDGELLAGSRRLQRRRPPDDEMHANLYWYPATLAPVTALLDEVKARHQVVILYGEVYGGGVQSLAYGRPKGGVDFVAFDLCLDGDFLDHADFVDRCRRHGVPVVPVLGEGPFSLEWVRELSSGSTRLGGSHIREGVVVRPVAERRHPKVGRVVLKYLNDSYLLNDSLTAADTTDV